MSADPPLPAGPPADHPPDATWRLFPADGDTSPVALRMGTDVVLGPVIGEGGMGVVHDAFQTSLGRAVAVKRLKPPGAAGPARLFEHEARITAGLAHPGVLPVHDLAHIDGQPALIMKRIEGRTWADALEAARAGGGVDLPSAIRVLASVAGVAAWAHARGVLHLDIKPANVMLGDYGEVLLMDWGCAVIHDDAAWAAQPNLPRAAAVRAPLGTPAYLSPEQARGDGAALSPASDVFLLGAVLHGLLSGRPLRAGDTTGALLAAAARGEAPPPLAGPPALCALAAEALATDPAARLDSAAAFRGRLLHWLDTREARALLDDAAARFAALDATPPPLGAAQRLALGEVVGLLDHAARLPGVAADAAPVAARARIRLAEEALYAREPGLTRGLAVELPEGPERARLLARATADYAALAAGNTRARRLRIGLAGAAVALCAALIALGTLFARAESERRRAEAAHAFTARILSAADPARSPGADTTPLRAVLARARAEAAPAFAGDPALHAAVLADIAAANRAYGAFEDAADAWEDAAGLVAGLQPDAALHWRVLAAFARMEATGAPSAAELDAAVALAAEATRLPPQAPAHRDGLVLAGWAHRRAARWAESEAAYGAAIAAARAAGDTETMLAAQGSLAAVLADAGQRDAARALHTEVVEARSAQQGPRHPETLRSRLTLLSAEAASGRPTAAALAALAADIAATVPADHPLAADVVEAQLDARDASPGALDAAVRGVRDGLEGTLVERQGALALALPLGTRLMEAERPADVEALWAAAQPSAALLWGPAAPGTIQLHNMAAVAMRRQGRLADADAAYRSLLPAAASSLGPGHTTTLSIVHNLATLAVERGDARAGAALHTANLAARRAALGPSHPHVGHSLRGLARAVAAQGDAAAAAALHGQALDLQVQLRDAPAAAEAALAQAEAALAAGDPATAAAALGRLDSAGLAVPPALAAAHACVTARIAQARGAAGAEAVAAACPAPG